MAIQHKMLGLQASGTKSGLGNIPVFLAALKNVPPRRQLYVIMRELIFALVVLLAFLYGVGALYWPGWDCPRRRSVLPAQSSCF